MISIREVVSNCSAREQVALDISKKAVGGFTLAPSSTGISLGSSSFSERNRAAQFRGWLYSAVHALALEAAGQPVSMGVSQSDQEREDDERLHHVLTKRSRNRIVSRTSPLSFRTKTAGEEFDVIMEHPFLDAIEKPNDIQDRWQFTYSFVANLNLTGRAYIVGGPTDGGYEFYSLPSSWVEPVHKKGPYSEFKVRNPRDSANQNNAPLIPKENVQMAYLPNPLDPLGAMAPAQAQTRGIGIDEKIQLSQDQFFDNGVFPSVVITVGKDPHPDAPGGGTRPRLTAEQRRQVTSAIRKTWGGVANYGEPAIVDGLIENITRLSATSNEMGWEKSEKAARTRILSAFAVHPFILGEPIPIGSTAQAAVIRGVFCKRVNVFLDMLSLCMTRFAQTDLDTENTRQRTYVWWKNCEAEDEALKHARLLAARKNGDITKNEFRAELGYPPDENDDENRATVLDSPLTMQQVMTVMKGIQLGELTEGQAAAILQLSLQLTAERAMAMVQGRLKEDENDFVDVSLTDENSFVGQMKESLKQLRYSPNEIAQALIENV